MIFFIKQGLNWFKKPVYEKEMLAEKEMLPVLKNN
jgi:hypothetical protein